MKCFEERFRTIYENGRPEGYTFVDLNATEMKMSWGMWNIYAAVMDGEIVAMQKRDVSRCISHQDAIRAARKTRWCSAAARKMRELEEEVKAEVYREAQAWKAARMAEGFEIWEGRVLCREFSNPLRLM